MPTPPSSIDEFSTPNERVRAVREAIGGFGADLALDCSGSPAAGPEGVEMLRDGGTYVEMGQFTDAGSIDTSWHRMCVKEVQILGSWAFTPDEVDQAITNLYSVQYDYDWTRVQSTFPLSERGVADAIAAASAMECVKATIVPGL